MPRGAARKIDAGKLRDLVEAGATMVQITDILHVTQTSVWRACKREGIPLPQTSTYKKRPVSVPPIRVVEPVAPPPPPPRLSQLIATGGRYADLSAWANTWGETMTQARLEWHRLGLPLRAIEARMEGAGK